MEINSHLVLLGEAIHEAIRDYAIERRKLPGWRPSGIDRNLQGACVAASYLLCCEANKRNIPSHLILGDRHAFLKHGDLFYDPTFVQFVVPTYQDPGPNDPKCQVWQPDQIPSRVAHKYRSDLSTTAETLNYLHIYHPDEALDGYQLHWITDNKAHISWSGNGLTINPMH
jgi:hypothetical protein